MNNRRISLGCLASATVLAGSVLFTGVAAASAADGPLPGAQPPGSALTTPQTVTVGNLDGLLGGLSGVGGLMGGLGLPPLPAAAGGSGLTTSTGHGTGPAATTLIGGAAPAAAPGISGVTSRLSGVTGVTGAAGVVPGTGGVTPAFDGVALPAQMSGTGRVGQLMQGVRQGQAGSAVPGLGAALAAMP